MWKPTFALCLKRPLDMTGGQNGNPGERAAQPGLGNRYAEAAGGLSLTHDTGSTQRAGVTIITAIKPDRLSKGFSLGANGDLLQSPGGQLTEGEVEVRKIDRLTDFAEILKSLTPKQALVYEVPIDSTTRVVTGKAFAEAGKPAGATTRTNDRYPSVRLIQPFIAISILYH